MQERITLDEVKEAFDQWRAGKLHQRERTPRTLREQVKAIAPYYSRQHIIKTLAINLNQMNRYDPSNQRIAADARFNEASNEFIEVPIPALPKIEQPQSSASGLLLSITRSDGSCWTLTEATQEVISESLCLFLRG
jgi:hypothetical protein